MFVHCETHLLQSRVQNVLHCVQQLHEEFLDQFEQHDLECFHPIPEQSVCFLCKHGLQEITTTNSHKDLSPENEKAM